MATGWIKRRELKNGKVRYDVRWRSPVTGKEESKTFARWKDADAFLTDTKNKINRRTYQAPKDILFSELADKYLNLQQQHLRPKSYASYEPHVKRLKTYFGDYYVRNIGQELVEQFASELTFAGKIFTLTTLESNHPKLYEKLTKKLKKKELKTLAETNEAAQDTLIRTHLGIMEKMAPVTAKNCLMILSSIFIKSMQWEYVERNPVQFVKRPKKPKRDMDFFTLEEFAALIANVDERHRCMILTIGMAGLRLSEALGLRWEDIDFDNNYLLVRQIVQQGKFYEPKTEASRRTIELPDFIIDELRGHRAFQSVRLDENPHNLVFPGKNGGPLDGRNFTRRVLYPALENAGIRKLERPTHALRHCYISALAKQKADLKFVQKQAGHSSAEMTLDIYTHLYPNSGRGELQKLETTFKAAMRTVKQNKETVTEL